MARLALLLLTAASLWLPTVHSFYRLDAEGRARLARQLAAREAEAVSARPRQASVGTEAMRSVNPEWDFMRRTYVVLALANRALDMPTERARDLHAIDAIVDGTIASLSSEGDGHFMLPYARSAPFVDAEAKSLFIDGELVLMIGARELVEPRKDAAARQVVADALARARRIERTMRRSPTLSGESYPDECWTFCNTTALAGLVTLARALPTTDAPEHVSLAREWVDYAKARLVDTKTGLLVSSYTRDGRVLDGPEGSSLWMSAHNLIVVDGDFARDQFVKARRELGASFLGFGWAREWPRGTPPRPDVDSGPIVPLLDASPGSSGLALLGARAFGDETWLAELLASLELAGFRDEASGGYRASNEVGDAVLSYALSFGPLWQRVARPEGPAMEVR